MVELQTAPTTLYDFLENATPFAVLALIALAVIFLLSRAIDRWAKVEAIKADALKQKTANEADSEKNRAEAARFVAAAETARLTREEIKEKNLEAREAQQTVTNQQMGLLLASLLTGQQLEVGAAARSEKRIIDAGADSEDRMVELMERQFQIFIDAFGEPPFMNYAEKAMRNVANKLKQTGQQAAGEAVEKAADDVGDKAADVARIGEQAATDGKGAVETATQDVEKSTEASEEKAQP